MPQFRSETQAGNYLVASESDLRVEYVVRRAENSGGAKFG